MFLSYCFYCLLRFYVWLWCYLGCYYWRKSPLCFWCLIHWLHLSSTTGGGFKSLVGCGFKSLYFTTSFPLVNNSPVCAVLRTYELRNLRSSPTRSIRRNPLCCLGCQLMSNRFAQHQVAFRFWMNCAICAEWRSARRHPDERGSPGRLGVGFVAGSAMS